MSTANLAGFAAVSLGLFLGLALAGLSDVFPPAKAML